MTDSGATRTSRRATLRLLRECDNACVFCAQHGEAPGRLTATDVATALRALRADADEVTFVGGEPTLFPDLAAAIHTARELGFSRVGIQSHLRNLADEARARALTDAGLTDAVASIHAGEAEAHDYHTGVSGSLAQSLAAISHLRHRGAAVATLTVLTRSNFRSLSTLPSLLARRGVSAWCVTVPHVAGRALASFDRVVPRLGMALPFALHAIEQAAKIGLAAFVQGAPLCMLGPFAARSIADVERAFAPVCAACPARATCPGLDASYLARFHADEITPRRAPTDVATVTDERARMFVGVGTRIVPESAESARHVSLPMLP